MQILITSSRAPFPFNNPLDGCERSGSKSKPDKGGGGGN